MAPPFIPLGTTIMLVSWVVLSLFIVRTGHEFGIWFVGAATQAVLAMISVYAYTLVSDMGIYGLAQRTRQCASLTKWLRVEVCLCIVCALACCILDPHYVMSAVYIAYLVVELVAHKGTWGNSFLIGKRSMSPADSFRESGTFLGTMKIKLAFHVTMLILMMAYIGPFVEAQRRSDAFEEE